MLYMFNTFTSHANILTPDRKLNTWKTIRCILLEWNNNFLFLLTYCLAPLNNLETPRCFENKLQEHFIQEWERKLTKPTKKLPTPVSCYKYACPCRGIVFWCQGLFHKAVTGVDGLWFQSGSVWHTMMGCFADGQPPQMVTDGLEGTQGCWQHYHCHASTHTRTHTHTHTHTHTTSTALWWN